MRSHTEPDPTLVLSSSLATSLREEHNFEASFGIPPAHRLVAVRSRSQGGPTPSVCWEHDEYDASGRLIARYKSFEQVTAAGDRHSGWRKFNSADQLVSERIGLP